jgi:hypothetical protein
LEAITRLVMMAKPLWFTIRNINGKSYLEEIRGGEENIPDFKNS